MTRQDRETVLIVEDDPKTASLLAAYCQRDGFHTVIASDGLAGVTLARESMPVCLILDLMMPGLDGWEVCREVRRFSDVPILMLSAREEEADRIAGLMLGADDYVVKPFSPREIVVRVKTILRRMRASPARTETLICGALEVDEQKHRVSRRGEAVDVTPSEFALLCALMKRPGKVFTRSELLRRLYPNGDAVIDRVVDVHIGNLRQKVEPDPRHPTYVLTVRGVGYSLTDADPAELDSDSSPWEASA